MMYVKTRYSKVSWTNDSDKCVLLRIWESQLVQALPSVYAIHFQTDKVSKINMLFYSSQLIIGRNEQQ